jgi:hypothetical protein
MLFNCRSLFVGISLISQVLSAPILESRATAGASIRQPIFIRIDSSDLSPAASAFPDLHRAAQLSSAAYSGCRGNAFDVTITKRVNDILTGTDVGVAFSLYASK